MSRRYDEASVSTLNPTVSPRLTLIAVAKPWIVGSPAPSTSHSSCGDPGRQFSASMPFAGSPQDARATGGAARPKTAPRTAAIAEAQRTWETSRAGVRRRRAPEAVRVKVLAFLPGLVVGAGRGEWEG